jgi:AraC-like DNA-binding protein
MVVTDPRALYQRFLPDHERHAYVWKYSQAVGGRRPRHFHAEPELNIVVRGSATFGVGEAVTRVTRGELIAFPSGQDHVLVDASPDLYLYAVGLEPSYSATVLGPSEPILPLQARLDEAELEKVLARAEAIVDRSGAGELGAELWERVHWLGRRAVAPPRRHAHVLTRQALARLRSTPELGLAALAKDLRAHPSELSRYFHRDVGLTLVRYRARLRLLQVIRLIDGGKLDLTAAACAAGFGSYSQCHRTFHSELGCAPRQFLFSELRQRMQLTYED